MFWTKTFGTPYSMYAIFVIVVRCFFILCLCLYTTLVVLQESCAALENIDTLCVCVWFYCCCCCVSHIFLSSFLMLRNFRMYFIEYEWMVLLVPLLPWLPWLLRPKYLFHFSGVYNLFNTKCLKRTKSISLLILASLSLSLSVSLSLFWSFFFHWFFICCQSFVYCCFTSILWLFLFYFISFLLLI